MACAHFTPNPFKEDICKNCQKSKGLHSGVFRVVYSTPPCPEFKANPFKHDICATCQQPKTVHKVSDRDYRGANWLTAHSELKSKDCDGYKEHAFKQDVCLTCGRKKEDHRSGGHRKVRHVDVFEMSSGCLEGHCEPSKCLLSNSHGPEYSVPEAGGKLLHNTTIQEATSHSFDPNLKENKEESLREGCQDFREHAFKRNLCINCGRTREFHKDVPRGYTPTHEVGIGDTDGNEGEKLGERNRGGCMKRGPAQASVKVPPKMRDDDASSESESGNEKVTPQKKVPAEASVKVPPKMRDDDASSESESENEKVTPQKKVPAQASVKVPPKMRDDDASSESENEKVTPQKKVPAQASVKVPPKMRDDDASSESESENEKVTPQKKVPAQASVKVPPKMRDDDASSESESESESVTHPKKPLSHWGTMPSPRDEIKGNGGVAVGGAAQGRVFLKFSET